MQIQIERDGFGRLVCAVDVDETSVLVTSAGAEAAAHDLLAAVDDVTVTGYGECLWPEVAGEYRWMLRRQGDALTVVVLWSSGTGTGWQHVVHTQTTRDVFARQLEPLRAMGAAFGGAPARKEPVVAGHPAPEEYASYYAKYVGLVPETDIVAALEGQVAQVRALARGVAAERETWRYGPDKWSVRQVIGHLIDGERVFGYRAFCFTRQEANSLPSFDENTYIANADYDRVPLKDLVEEFATVRAANVMVLRRLDETRWRLTGTASQNVISVRALAYVMAGHVRHHVAVLESRYGLTASV